MPFKDLCSQTEKYNIAMNNLFRIFLLLKHKQNTNNMHLLAPKVFFVSSIHYSLTEEIIIFHLRNVYSCLSSFALLV